MEKMARQTLTNGVKLIDPVWGGVDQYSTDGDWDHPHYEKIMPFQAETMRVLALASRQWNEPKWLEQAQKIHGYLKSFLTSPEGAFYTSQDADLVEGEHGEKYFALDDAARRKLGIPRVDTHIYSRENGLAICGLAALYAASGDASCLAEARRAAAWVQEHRALPDGGFRHDERDSAGPYLADTLAMARAFLALYTVTAEREWLAKAQAAAAFMDAKFRAPVGFATAASNAKALFLRSRKWTKTLPGAVRQPSGPLYRRGSSRAMAKHAMRYLAAPAIIQSQGFSTSGILLADREMRRARASDHRRRQAGSHAARALFASALRGAPDFARIEWFDSKGRPAGRMPTCNIPNCPARQPSCAPTEAARSPWNLPPNSQRSWRSSPALISRKAADPRAYFTA
jgi:hypothetical protein